MSLKPEAFVAKLNPYAVVAADLLSVNRTYATVFLVQWAHESGFEQADWCGYNNYAGITGGPYRFRRYDSIAAFVLDYVQVLNLEYYAPVRAAMSIGAPVPEVLTALGASPWDEAHYRDDPSQPPGELLQEMLARLQPYVGVPVGGGGGLPAPAPVDAPPRGLIAEFYSLGADCSMQALRYHGSWRRSWSMIIPGQFSGSSHTDLLFYDRAAGEAECYTSDGTGLIAQLHSYQGWRSSWHTILPGRFADGDRTSLLFYDRDAGEAEIWQMDKDGAIDRVGGVTPIGQWDLVVPGPFGQTGLTGLFFYSREAGRGLFCQVNPDGSFTRLKETAGLRTSWNVILAGRFGGNGITDMLFYDAAAGEVEIYAVDAQCALSTLLSRSFGWLATIGQIVPGQYGGKAGVTDLLFYDAAAGTGSFCTPDGAGGLRLMRKYEGWRTSWQQIIPGQFGGSSLTGLLFYDPSGQEGATWPAPGERPAIPDPDAVPPPDTAPWNLYLAPIQSTLSSRSPELLDAVIRQFHVATAPRYRKNQQGKDETYCNIFLCDVSLALQAEIPHRVSADGVTPVHAGGHELDANATVRWMLDHGDAYGWSAADASQAMDCANAGKPAVVLWQNPGGIGHVAVVRPGAPDAGRGLPTAQAGESNFDDRYLRDGFGNRPVLYYVHE